MNYDSITLNECSNDISKVYLYYVDDTGQWCAFGISAYLTDKVLTPNINRIVKSFSRKMQMSAVTMTNTVFEQMHSTLISHNIDGGKMSLSGQKDDLSEYATWNVELKNR